MKEFLFISCYDDELNVEKKRLKLKVENVQKEKEFLYFFHFFSLRCMNNPILKFFTSTS
jgi:hypothetical protein